MTKRNTLCRSWKKRKLYTETKLKPLIDQLIAERKKQQLTQTKLNEEIGYTDSLVSRWECGDRTPSAFALFVWAEALGYTVTLKKTKE